VIELEDLFGRSIRVTEERWTHIETEHPEMRGARARIQETLAAPDVVVRSRTDDEVELFHKLYQSTPVTTKHLCVVAKVKPDDRFVVTAYYADRVKQGARLWQKK
jgi:hypothetical protein